MAVDACRDRQAEACIVEDALAKEATRRASGGLQPLSKDSQEALALRALVRSFGGSTRVGSAPLGRVTTDDEDEDELAFDGAGTSVGRGPFDLMLADETVEDIAATRYDMVFTYHSDGSVRRRPERWWPSTQDLVELRCRTLHERRDERNGSSTAQQPLLTMRIGRGLRLAAQRDVSENVSFTLRRNTLGKVMMADLVGLRMFPPVLGDLFTAMGSAPEMRIAIGGATGAGKTTLSRAILNEQPPQRRIVIIEDTAELDLFDERCPPERRVVGTA